MDLSAQDVTGGVRPLPLPVDVPHPVLPGLHLRRLHADDARAFQAAVTSPAIGRMLSTFPLDWSLAEAEAMIAAHHMRDAGPFRLAIADQSGAFLGSVGLTQVAPAEISFFLTAQAQAKGIMRAALGVFLKLVTPHFALSEVQARVYHDNPASIALLRSFGFVETGRAAGPCSAQRDGADLLYTFRLICARTPKS